MMLNNKVNHSTVKISKVTDDRIILSIFDNEHCSSLNMGESKIVKWQFDKTLMPDASLSYEDNQIKEAYNHLLTLSEYSDFEYSDIKKWSHSARNIRMYIDNNQVVSSLEANDELNTIITRLRDENMDAEEKFIFRCVKYSIIYVNEILPGDSDVLTAMDIVNKTIFIENKI